MLIKPNARRVLFLLTAVNYLNYIDRYILAAVLASIKLDLQLSDLEAGALATAFMLPYMLTSPLFGYLGDRFPRPRILAFGATLWSLASVATGFSQRLGTLISSRFFLGFGESAFTVTSVPFISEHFQKNNQGRALAIFSTALPVGAALGYVLGGWLGQLVGWRGAFYVVGAPGLMLAAFVYFLKDPRGRKLTRDLPFRRNFFGLFKSRSYAFTVLGYCAYTFVVGGVAHWVPTYMQRMFKVDQMHANLIFGGIAVVTGLTGTLSGGYFSDWWNKRRQGAHMHTSSYSMLLSVPFFILCLLSDNLVEFSIYLSLLQFFFFLSTSPVSVAILEAAPAHLKTSAMAMAIFACHILGDAISSPLIGYLSDATGSLRFGMLACAPVILLSGMLWLLAARHNRRDA